MPTNYNTLQKKIIIKWVIFQSFIDIIFHLVEEIKKKLKPQVSTT